MTGGKKPHVWRMEYSYQLGVALLLVLSFLIWRAVEGEKGAWPLPVNSLVAFAC